MMKLKMGTNFNNKLFCDLFLHITLAPPQPVPEHKLGQQYHIEVLDQSHPGGVAELLFFYRFELGAAVDIYTMPSHGLDAVDFIEWFLKENPTANYGTELAVYFYKKVSINSNDFAN
jgi:hypothetical protein